MQHILEHWQLSPAYLPLFLDDADGLAALALLANAGAKDWPERPGNIALYAEKAERVRWACLAATSARSWVDTHEDMPIYFVETGLLLDGEVLQLAFHFAPSCTVPELPGWPLANGRQWRGQRAQARALEIAVAYLARRGIYL